MKADEMKATSAEKHSSSNSLVAAARRLALEVNRLKFGAPVTHVYNPLDYAWASHETYLRRFGRTRKKVIFLGMNPGPFGMVQTGVPFGEVNAVRHWMKIEAPIGKPSLEHARRPVEGFACRRSEVSGRRLWGLFAKRFSNAEEFFADHFVANFCPLAFLEASGRNRTPDKLPAPEIKPLFAACDRHLRALVEILEPQWVIGIGVFAARRAELVLENYRGQIGKIAHPSPASPAANRDWAGAVSGRLRELGIWR